MAIIFELVVNSASTKRPPGSGGTCPASRSRQCVRGIYTRENSMAATLKLTREVSFGFELRRGRFDISVDGKNVGSLNRSETVETPIAPGFHMLRIQAGRYSSRDHSFDVADGEVVSFRCHGAMIWPTYVASFAKPDLAISLKRD
jgi:hypothetical protein